MSARTVLVALLAVACNDATLTRGRTAPTVSIRSPADGAGYVEGEPITVVAKVDDDQSPASDLDYAWTADGFALDGEDTLEDAEVTFVLPEGLDAGEHTIRVEVTDPDAMSGDDEVTVRVAANEVPTLAFLAPEEGGRVFDNQPVTVSLQVADADADDLSRHVLTWTGLDADPPAPDADGLATTEVGPLAVGDYEIDATVTDPGGETAGASVRFTVAPADADDDGHDDVDAGGDDCDDADPEVYGGGEEACNGEDDNCDGIVPGDETDADGDGWMICEGDCDDDNLDVHPEAGEICDGLDDDCDGQTPDDEADADGDGWRACAGDCDDGDALVSPDDVELCNGWDDDCDGTVDGADAVDASTWYTDADADEWGDPASPVVACEQPADAVADATDCNDADDAVNPAATEACNGVDDDCDGTIDEDGATGSVVYYADTDGDGYGDPDTTAALCSPASGWVSDVLDCDDTEATVNPASTEVCDDGLDNDCDGTGNACGLGGEEGPGDALGVLVGVNSYGDVGGSVAGLPDFDGDGYGDILVGDPLYDGSRSNSGAAWIFLGAPSGEEWISGAHLMLEGSGTGDDAGTTVAYVGDLDRDGLSDAMIGAPDASGAGSGSGSAYLVYGGAAAGTLDLGSADAELRGETKNDAAGSALAGPGDVDGDGADDVMVGAPHESSVGTNSGAAYVFGGPVYGTFDLAGADLVLRGEATGDRAGYAVAGA
ncbi:MAG: FG-GAP repeat protein, partial [Deltaproteobacteria bacterium]|nr:FG-GAP repeat protein [Deltaproteobacteria bacterium]